MLAEIDKIDNVFEDSDPREVTPPPVSKKPSKPGTYYKWMKGDQLPIVAKRLGYGFQELLDHNGLDSADQIKVGDELHLPIPIEVKEQRSIVIDLLPEELPMHVVTLGGCKKWAFGNMQKWADAKSSGFFPQNTNLKIVATALVPIIDDNGEETEAGYYLDSHALGDYTETKKIRWAVGYMWSDLSEGHIDPVPKRKPAPLAEQRLKDQKAKEIAKKVAEKAAAKPAYLDGFDQAFIEKRLAEIIRDGKDYFKLSRQVLEYPIPCTAHLPEGREDGTDERGRYVIIHDIDTRRPDRKLYHNQEVEIGQTFEYDDVLMGRPTKACETGNWFGIDMTLLQADKDLYNDKQDAAQTRAAEGRSLTWSERWLWVPLAKATTKKQKNNKRTS